MSKQIMEIKDKLLENVETLVVVACGGISIDEIWK